MQKEQYLTENYSSPLDFWDKFHRSGLTKFPPCIVSVAITGGNQGKESNPNLPETLEEQVQQTYDAYKAGASLVHIHCRCPDDPSRVTDDPEVYRELNRRIRERCPDIIINNTVIGGRWSRDGVMYPPMNVAIPARPEVGSVDITNYTWSMLRKARPEAGRPEDHKEEMQYTINKAELDYTFTEMKKYGVKPEFELFDIGDLQYIRELTEEGKLDPAEPNWIQMVFTPALTYQTPDMLLAVMRHLPRNSVMGAICTGSAQFPFLAMAIVMGCHVRVGMEDGYYIEKGKLAESNAQLVDKIVTIAKLLGRPVATPAQAREILGLGAPRQNF